MNDSDWSHYIVFNFELFDDGLILSNRIDLAKVFVLAVSEERTLMHLNLCLHVSIVLKVAEEDKAVCVCGYNHASMPQWDELTNFETLRQMLVLILGLARHSVNPGNNIVALRAHS